MTPLQAMEARYGMRAAMRTVNAYGELFLEGCDWFCEELLQQRGKRVYLMLAVSQGSLVLQVYDLAGMHLCMAKKVERGAVTVAELEALMAKAESRKLEKKGEAL
jgi:hypothetical protein